MTPIRVRFAPSPTGPLHIGGVRTALYNYLFARRHKGVFILRIEDTDQNRFVDGAEEYILDSLKWLGIEPDEGPNTMGKYGPYRQSERKDIYDKYIQELLNNGSAYYAFDTPEELDAHRKYHESQGKTFIYNWHNRMKLKNSLSLSKEETDQYINSNIPYVIRFLVKPKETLQLKDLLRDDILIDTSTLDDKILYKSDGLPTYHFANIVDDHLMKITHVIRGEEWLPSLPLHVLLYQSFGWHAPKFAHLPLILKPTGKGKLSKRDGDAGGFPVFPLDWKDTKGFYSYGFTPEATLNFLALLGWNPGTEQEIFTLEELVETFNLLRIQKSGAKFDFQKALWFNQQWLQQTDDHQLLEAFKKELTNDLETNKENAYHLSVISLVKERAQTIKELVSQSIYFYKPPINYDQKTLNRLQGEPGLQITSQISHWVKTAIFQNPEQLNLDLKKTIENLGLPMGKVMQTLRMALVGNLSGPNVTDIIFVIGKEQTLARLEKLKTML